jgi:hypothetical protein
MTITLVSSVPGALLQYLHDIGCFERKHKPSLHPSGGIVFYRLFSWEIITSYP